MSDSQNKEPTPPRRIWKTNHCTINAFASANELAAAIAEQWIQFIRHENQPLSIALSGGRIARPLFTQITRQTLRAQLDCRRLRFFWADERCVPSYHQASNFRLAQKHLLQPLRIDTRQQFPFIGSVSPEVMAKKGLEMLRTAFGNPNQTSKDKTAKTASIPILDLAILGMGEDGHIASLFPENMETDLHRPQACFHVTAGKPPPHRITLSYNVLAAAKQTWILVSGKGKTKTLLQAIQNQSDTPIRRLLSRRHSTQIFTDLPLLEPKTADPIQTQEKRPFSPLFPSPKKIPSSSKKC